MDKSGFTRSPGLTACASGTNPSRETRHNANRAGKKALSPCLAGYCFASEIANPSDDYKRQLRRILGWSSNDREAKNVPESESAETIESPSAIGAWLNRNRLEQKLSVPELADKAGLAESL